MAAVKTKPGLEIDWASIGRKFVPYMADTIIESLLEKPGTSPIDVARATGQPVSNVDYYFRKLCSMEVIELIDIVPVRGVTRRHHYKLNSDFMLKNGKRRKHG